MVKTPCFYCQDRHLAGKLRSCKLRGAAKKKKKVVEMANFMLYIFYQNKKKEGMPGGWNRDAAWGWGRGAVSGGLPLTLSPLWPHQGGRGKLVSLEPELGHH